jgi:hypothetical protein
MEEWRLCQAQFVDDPGAAILQADRLVAEIMRARGYTGTTAPERLAEMSAAYPKRTSEYRRACEVADRHSEGNASTEDLREGIIEYRALFDDLLGENHEQHERAS